MSSRLTFSDRPVIREGRRIGDSGELADIYTTRFPAHARPLNQMPDSPGPFGQGCWKIYSADFHPETKPAEFGFKHRDTLWRRVQERGHNGLPRWTTRGTFPNAVMFSS
jgi:hypothetical protein